VNKVSKVILSTLAILATLVVLLIVGANLYLQSPGMQARIQAGISKALRMPVRFASTSISMAGRLQIAGITVPDGDRKFLEADAFTAHYRLGPLLRGQLEIYDLAVERPKIVWWQNAEGHWVVPSLPREEDPPKAAPGTAPHAEAEQARASGWGVVVEGFQIRNGSVELLDKEGKFKASLAGVNVTYTTLTAERLAGEVQIGRLSWADELVFEKVRTPFTYAAGELTLPELRAGLAGGTVTGKFSMQTERRKAPFALQLGVAGVDAGQLSAQMHSALGKAAGSIGGTLALHGLARDLKKAEGAGQLQIREGRLQQLELFEAIGEVLEIKELSDLKLKDGRVVFRIGDERAHVDELVLEAADLRLSTKGTIKFDGRIQLAAKLSIEESLRKHLPGLIRGNFEPAEDQRSAISFDITGKDFRARTNLLDRIVGKKITSQLGDLVTSLFGPRKKDEKKEEKKKSDGDKKKDAAPDQKKDEGAAPALMPPAPPAPPAAAEATPEPAAPKPPEAAEPSAQ